MELNLLFLPLLGGYIFFVRFNGTAYHAKRASGHTLIFGSAAIALVFLVVARVIVVSSLEIGTDPDPWIALGMHMLPGAACATVMGIEIMRSGAVGPKEREAEETRTKWLLGLAAAGILWVPAAMVVREPVDRWLLPSSIVLLSAALAAHVLHRITDTPRGAVGFRAATFLGGMAISLAAFASHVAIIDQWWQKLSPYENSGTAFLACVLAASVWFPLNSLYPFTAAVSRLHSKNRTNALDKFLHDAAYENQLVQLSLTDAKFYIGILDWTPPNPEASNSYVRLLPYASGYRDKETKELKFTTYYDSVYAELAKEDELEEADLDAFLKILPVTSITSASRFDPNLFVRFDRARQEHAAQAGIASDNSPKAQRRQPWRRTGRVTRRWHRDWRQALDHEYPSPAP